MRRFVFLLSVLLLSSCSGFSHENIISDVPSQQNTMKQVYSSAFRTGVAVNEAIVSGKDRQASAIVTKHFNTITPENVMKAEVLNPSSGVYNFGPADKVVNFAEEHDLFLVGHTLVWHNQVPEWFFKNEQGLALTPAAQIERMRQYIETVAGRYSGRVDAWDVVNEVIAEDGSYRPTKWVNAVGDGDELVKQAFRFAERYAPGAELYYNDFNAWRPQKRDGIVRMVKMLQAEGIRIDGIGIQGHWGLNFPNNDYIEAAIDAYADLGLKVMISELDIDVLPLTREGQVIGTAMMHPQFQLEEFKSYLDPYQESLPEEVQGALTSRYRDLYQLFYRKRDKIDRVTLWGVHDSMSWKNGYPIPGRRNYPLLFDRDYQSKPALDAVLSVPQRP